MDVLTQVDRHFRFTLALSRSDLQKAFALRYQVYCQEFRFEKEEDCCGGLETDCFDSSSVHCLLEHRGSGQVAGCVRMVLPVMDSSGSLDALPLERHCVESLSHRHLHPARLPRQSICEISRLAVSRVFRRRQGEGRSEMGNIHGLVPTDEMLRTAPVIGLSLFLAATAMVGMAGRHHVFAMMEPRLVRLLSVSGFRFFRVGEFVDYHGQRAAYYTDQRQVVLEMQEALRGIYHSIQQQIFPGFEQLAADAATASRLMLEPVAVGSASMPFIRRSS
ncbi:PEP-CTERM/exosortase system-associated acyltransferase [Methylonatrum kenyense]|uniref:PEP-CTERM/exosortase system-associated acyltransferase n=1 Tax=Methylonatrum kenyense TaxID=455253 RepID=UPI0020BFD7B6|nr:PEP-CTERM/exosortase system-associated acyltransferase [Methylonatrum kenyense]MCK8515045.1 PEP-CTERM/exosortase system-associated acyltransferase [Methylonatrum kenyense]